MPLIGEDRVRRLAVRGRDARPPGGVSVLVEPRPATLGTWTTFVPSLASGPASASATCLRVLSRRGWPARPSTTATSTPSAAASAVCAAACSVATGTWTVTKPRGAPSALRTAEGELDDAHARLRRERRRGQGDVTGAGSSDEARVDAGFAMRSRSAGAIGARERATPATTRVPGCEPRTVPFGEMTAESLPT